MWTVQAGPGARVADGLLVPLFDKISPSFVVLGLAIA